MKRLISLRRRWKWIVLAFLLTGVVAVYLQRQFLLTKAGCWLIVSNSLHEPVDYVLVLGGGATTRPFVAAEIVRAGLAKKVLIPRFSQSEEVRDGISISEDEMMRQVLLRSDVSAEAIVQLDAVVDSTKAEARALADFLREIRGLRVAVVTSDFHTRRSRLLFSRACGDDVGNLTFIGAPTDGFDASNWWRTERGTVAYVNEYLKLLLAIAS